MPPSFEIDTTSSRLIDRIVARVKLDRPSIDTLNLTMDLTACHANGCELELSELLEAPDGDFWHDINGIQDHISRNTGKLEDFFVPRYAASQRTKETA